MRTIVSILVGDSSVPVSHSALGEMVATEYLTAPVARGSAAPNTDEPSRPRWFSADVKQRY
jgi:hypothetical protein